jgi:hypothetical protein
MLVGHRFSRKLTIARDFLCGGAASKMTTRDSPFELGMVMPKKANY